MVLLAPTELGRLASNSTTAMIEILPNQDPHGVLQITPADSQLVNGGLLVEESTQWVNYEVTRTRGTFGEVTVAVETFARSATSASGKTSY